MSVDNPNPLGRIGPVYSPPTVRRVPDGTREHGSTGGHDAHRPGDDEDQEPMLDATEDEPAPAPGQGDEEPRLDMRA